MITFPTLPRCLYHGEALDPDTGCDHCRRDDTLRSVECRVCDGWGTTSRRHPTWGQASCPEPYLEETCDACAGTGWQS